MNKIDIKNARKNLFQLVEYVNANSSQIKIVNSDGKNTVLISEDKWKSIEETLHLSFIYNINNIRKNENWKTAKVFDPDEEW